MNRRRVPARCLAETRPSSIYVRRILRAEETHHQEISFGEKNMNLPVDRLIFSFFAKAMKSSPFL